MGMRSRRPGWGRRRARYTASVEEDRASCLLGAVLCVVLTPFTGGISLLVSIPLFVLSFI